MRGLAISKKRGEMVIDRMILKCGSCRMIRESMSGFVKWSERCEGRGMICKGQMSLPLSTSESGLQLVCLLSYSGISGSKREEELKTRQRCKGEVVRGKVDWTRQVKERLMGDYVTPIRNRTRAGYLVRCMQ